MGWQLGEVAIEIKKTANLPIAQAGRSLLYLRCRRCTDVMINAIDLIAFPPRVLWGEILML